MAQSSDFTSLPNQNTSCTVPSHLLDDSNSSFPSNAPSFNCINYNISSSKKLDYTASFPNSFPNSFDCSASSGKLNCDVSSSKQVDYNISSSALQNITSFDSSLSDQISSMENCTLCPRNCHANRAKGEIGYCGQTNEITCARAALHMWEEPCISGTSGSGTVFFSGCNLRCIFCQNYKIAHENNGKKISIERLSQIFLELQQQGANNINLVTPTHFTPQIAAALRLARKEGLYLPIVYNTSSYESVSTLQLLEGFIDIYLPDCKYISPSLSQSYSHAPDYFAHASKAIAEMYRQVGSPLFDSASGLMKKGVIVRHLILPGQTKDSKKILRYLHNTYGNNIYISIMNQYTPLFPISSVKELNRTVTKEEYLRVIHFAQRIGIENGFIQEGETASESFIPSFHQEGV